VGEAPHRGKRIRQGRPGCGSGVGRAPRGPDTIMTFSAIFQLFCQISANLQLSMPISNFMPIPREPIPRELNTASVCGCKRNVLSLGHRLAVAASMRRPVRSAVQTGQFRTATCQNGWLNGGRHPPAGRPAAAARRLRRGVSWHARWPVLRWNRCVVLHMHVARAHGSRRRRRRPALATTNGARGWQLFVGAVVASPVAAATATAN